MEKERPVVAGMRKHHGIVTPEAVRLELEPAGVGSRCVAFALDLGIQVGTLWTLQVGALLIAARSGIGLPTWAGVTLLLGLAFLIIWGYPVAFETLWRGRSPGKAAMGLRVVTAEGGPVGLRHAALRAALLAVDVFATLAGAGIITMLVTQRSQRLGDLVAGTIVLRERTGAGAAAATEFALPAGMEGYAATLDVSALRPADYSAVRSFLLRAPSLGPDVRAQLAGQLATPLAARMAHTPPGDVTPEQFLRCLAARYQQRGAGSDLASHPRGGSAAGEQPSPDTAPPATPGEATSSSSKGGFAPPA